MSNQPQTRTLQSYFNSLPLGLDPVLIGAGLKRVQAASEGVPGGGTTGQLLGKISDSDFDADWVDPPASAGTVTSVGLAAPSDLTVTNSPVTGTGTLTLTRAAGFEAYTSAEKTKLSGIATGADVTNATTVAAAIHGATGKTTPVDADELGLIDSAASNVLKKLTWANLKATVRTYLLGIANVWTKTQRGDIVFVSSGTTITLDLDLGQEFRINAPGLAHNATLQLSNANNHIGAKFSFTGYNNAGGNTLSYGTGLTPIGAASAPAIPTGAAAKWRVDGQITASGEYQFTTRGVGV